MAEQVQLEETDLTALQQLDGRSKALIRELGRISLAEIQLEERREAAENFLKESRKIEGELAKALEDKYGKGNVDIQTGIFTPSE